MSNTVINEYGNTKFTLTKNSVDNLKSFTPKGCPFKDYTLFDLLMDLFNMYSWKIRGKKSVSEFITYLQSEGYEKAIVYGDGLIKLLA